MTGIGSASRSLPTSIGVKERTTRRKSGSVNCDGPVSPYDGPAPATASIGVERFDDRHHGADRIGGGAKRLAAGGGPGAADTF